MIKVNFDKEKLHEDFSTKKRDITEIIILKSVVNRRRNMLDADSNSYLKSRESVLKGLERNMFALEMKFMAQLILDHYGHYWDGGRYWHHKYIDKIVKNKGINPCQITSQGLRLILSSSDE